MAPDAQVVGTGRKLLKCNVRKSRTMKRLGQLFAAVEIRLPSSTDDQARERISPRHEERQAAVALQPVTETAQGIHEAVTGNVLQHRRGDDEVEEPVGIASERHDESPCDQSVVSSTIAGQPARDDLIGRLEVPQPG